MEDSLGEAKDKAVETKENNASEGRKKERNPRVSQLDEYARLPTKKWEKAENDLIERWQIF